MPPRFAKAIVLLLAVQLLGGHWAVLQTTAWVKMVVSYSQGDSFVSALEKTFDGAHPCGLCKVVKSGKSEEQKQQTSTAVVKLDAVLAPALAVPIQRDDGWEVLIEDHRHAARRTAPPVPPPLFS